MTLETRKRELLPEQAAAAHEIEKHVAVTAGPGSGKTTVLVERYLHILRKHNLNIDQIVAITFTNRAANEMRERLREQLDLILQTAASDDRRRWLNYKRTLDGAIITTIHGFCARLLREYPVEARVDPQFLLLDEHRAAMLLESVVEEVLREFIVAGHVEISRLTLGVGRARLAAALGQIYRDVRGQGLSLVDLALKTAESHATEDDHARAVVELSQAMDEFLVRRRTTPASRANHAEVSAAWRNLGPAITTMPPVEALADYCRAVEGFRKVRTRAQGELKEQVQTLDNLVWEKDLLGRVPQISLDLFAREYALEIALLLRQVDERLNQEKQKLAALDFDDLELRALALLERPEVVTRAAERYKFFLVDEFQDTNGLQRQLLERLAMRKAHRQSANLFIVGDRKQSIYGFRGADVAVFSEMTETLLAAGGESKRLLLNFRSQPPLINFFNYLFERLFEPQGDVSPEERAELGYVGHESSEAKRDQRDAGPLVELMITTESSGNEDDPKAEQGSRELDAEQLARRIISLVDPDRTKDGSVEFGSSDSVPFNESGRDARGPIDGVEYSDIALLFRAMTQVQVYESAFRRANIPYQTVLGRGFYEREEITDLIQLLRFLDNKTDELALAAVLRSPLCGISDNALLALRCAPWLDELDDKTADQLRHFAQTRKLYLALRRHREIAYIEEDEHRLLDCAGELIKGLIARQHHYSLSKLLRFAVARSEYETVVAATFDGAQRLANVQRLFTLAERFEGSGAHLIRDFVRYVEEFEAIGSRESEGQIDEATNAVKLMTIHQAKGLEFPIVIIPDLQRSSKPMENWVLLDRQGGLTLKVPDGRGRSVAGATFNRFEQRHALREQFESMRLLYVAATRAQDRLILSGTTKDLGKLGLKSDTWLNWIWQSLELPEQTRTGIVQLPNNVQLQVTLNIADQPVEIHEQTARLPEKQVEAVDQNLQPGSSLVPAESISETFPLLRSVDPERERAVHRFSVTQLINYQRCPRQYYFDRVLHAPAPDALAVWNDAEAPEPPANLTATLKGAVIHRFCETYTTKDKPEELLRRNFADVVRLRQAELADRMLEINVEEAIAELLPLAQNYLSSAVFQRVERALTNSGGQSSVKPCGESGLWSEVGFRLRRPLGILSGAIDKLLITPAARGKGFTIEIIDFKTNRLRGQTIGDSAPTPTLAPRPLSVEADADLIATGSRTKRPPSNDKVNQIPFDFNASSTAIGTGDYSAGEHSIAKRVRIAASDYQLQMQAYVLAVSELMPQLMQPDSSITSTLHFLEPNIEFHLEAELLSTEACARAIDAAIIDIVSSGEPAQFPVRTATHCRMCNFLGICPAGREWVRAKRGERMEQRVSLKSLAAER
jgi:ATP-dependent helicase/nuclease subunit A